MTAVIDAAGLTRSFGGRNAVDRLDLRIEAGEIFGLLGPNGAGKTTTIRMLTTLLSPTSGSARVCGFDIATEPGEVRRRVGYVMQMVAWRGELTGRECVEIEASLYHVPREAVRLRAAEVLELVGLTVDADKIWSRYSGGMKKRLDLACGLLNQPELLVLDEPTLGLDVQSRHRMWEHVRQQCAQGVSVLLATNYLDEADQLCDRLMIIDQGREIVTGTPEALKRAVGADIVKVKTTASDELRGIVEAQSWARGFSVLADGEVRIQVDDAAAALPVVMRLALDNGIELEGITYSQPTLDDVFLHHTGHELREDEAA